MRRRTMAVYAFFKGKIVPVEEAKISVMTHAFNYGTAVFEGLRAYWNAPERQLYVFKLPEHFARLHRSARIMRVALRYSVQ
jgi:branched-chain amino acid aminotransferase